MAVSHATHVLRWFDDLEPDEVPPEWMWPFPKELELWFDEVKELRREKYGISDDSSGRDAPGERMGQNELTAGIRR